MGWDGLAMLLLSLIWIAGTGGLSLLYFMRQAQKTAKTTGCSAPANGCRLVFGACLDADELPADFEARLQRALRLPAGRTLVMGGHTDRRSTRSEAAAGRNWLIEAGMPASLIEIEDGSRNTLENLLGARERLQGEALPVVLITSRYHLARTSRLADGLGLNHSLCAAEDRLSYTPRVLLLLLQEAVFLNWYAVGRSTARALGHRGMLRRIT